MKKLNKTEKFIQQNQRRKVGLFLPTLKQYQSMNKYHQRWFQKISRLLRSPDSLVRSRGYGFLTSGATIGALKGKRQLKARVARQNLVTTNLGMHAKFGHYPFKKGVFLRMAMGRGSGSLTKKALTTPPADFAQNMSKFGIYQTEDGYWIVYDETESPKVRGRGAKVDEVSSYERNDRKAHDFIDSLPDNMVVHENPEPLDFGG